MWVCNVNVKCECEMWVWKVSVKSECAMWVCNVSVKCECEMWVCNVSVQCECEMWVCNVSVQCECEMWMCNVSVKCECAMCDQDKKLWKGLYWCACTHGNPPIHVHVYVRNISPISHICTSVHTPLVCQSPLLKCAGSQTLPTAGEWYRPYIRMWKITGMYAAQYSAIIQIQHCSPEIILQCLCIADTHGGATDSTEDILKPG